MTGRPSRDPLSRREFVARAGAVAGLGLVGVPGTGGALRSALPAEPRAGAIRLRRAAANFEREPLVRPSGFKGGFMTEFWQSVALMESESGARGVGLGTQNVLWCDPTVLDVFTESGANSLMFAVTDRALQMARTTSFTTPIDLLDQVFDEVFAYAKRITGKPDLRPTFVLNALVPFDNAAWLLYARENGVQSFDEMVPAAYRAGVSHRNRQVASLPSVTYGLPLGDVEQAAREGYWLIKLKLGSPGTQAEMLERDMARMSQVHRAIGHLETPHTRDGRIRYDLDPNMRYGSKETLQRLLDHAARIGMLEQIVVVEEPFAEEDESFVGDLPVPIAADESATTEADTLRRIEQGYRGMALKAIAKTLSQTLKVARLSHERGIACMCADLTVNPILVDWNKNFAARLAPFPGLDVGMMETNGHQQYLRWDEMVSRHPCPDAPWRQVRRGVFELNDDFFERSGCIFQPSPHYNRLVQQVAG